MSKQLELWKGPFGDQYRERNPIDNDLLGSRFHLWNNTFQGIAMLGSVKGLPKSILEVGCGNGINLLAINRVYNINGEMCQVFANEPNKGAREEAQNNFTKESFYPIWLDDDSCANDLRLPNSSVDLVFTSGVLIHIHPDEQLKAMEEIYRISRRYIVCIEYFSPDQREINYHENTEALWTEDYGSKWLDNFNLRCLMSMFYWKRITKLDNLTVWVFEKVN